MKFKILHKDGKARVGLLETPHGVIETPNFNPVGTQATVKAMTPKDLKEIGVQMVLANTYHLMLRPGTKVIKGFGGLHKFMGWDRPIMTDSGGFQVFSLGGGMEEGASKVVSESMNHESRIMGEERKPRLNKITEEGVVFQSHLDGSTHVLSPEKSMELQYDLGADLIVSFDDHEYRDDESHLKKSLKLTEIWAKRSLKEYRRLSSAISHQTSLKAEDRRLITPLLYGVIHGGTNKDLRIKSAKFTDDNFEAIALGGIYGTKKQMYQMIDYTLPEVSENKIRHLLGIGEIEDLIEGIKRGVDMFDCVAPTRRARFGSLYVSGNQTLAIGQSKYKADKKPIDPKCDCYTCQNFSRSYLRHLYLSGEILYHELATYHNIYFITKLVEKIRKAIMNNSLPNLKL